MTLSTQERIAALDALIVKLDDGSQTKEDIEAGLRDFLGDLSKESKVIVRDEMLRMLERGGALSAASRWRASRPDLAGHGVVVVNRDGDAAGWMNELRDPHGWEPGCCAVDVHGSQWLATGGNDYDGAKAWLPIRDQNHGGAE